MEFLGNPEEDEEEQEDEDVSSFTTAPLPPAFQPVAMETLPMRFDHAHREEQAAVVTMEAGATTRTFNSAPEDYYTLRLRGSTGFSQYGNPEGSKRANVTFVFKTMHFL